MTAEIKGSGGQRGGNGFSFDGGGAGGGRDGKRGDGKRGGGKDGGRGGRGDKRDGGGAFRVVNELPELEKALTKKDWAAQARALENILKAVRPLRLKSLNDLSLDSRGKILTALMRVARQPKPAAAEVVQVPAESAAAPTTEPVAEVAAEGIPAAEAPLEAAAAETPSAETPNVEAPKVEAAPSAPPTQDPASAGYAQALYLVGNIWLAAKEADRAASAFALSGRPAPEALPDLPEEAATASASERPSRGPRGDKKGDGKRPSRGERPARTAPVREREPEGPWDQVAAAYEKAGRTRDAARLHEKNQSYVDAARLFEAGGDLKSALLNSLRCQDAATSERLLPLVKPDDAAKALAEAQAWEQLMAFEVKRNNFEGVARLYERAKQFDQAALAWEKADKWGAARKAYERAGDAAGVARARNAEVKKMVDRGDRLGAASMLLAAGDKEGALALLKVLAGQKTYEFMKRLKLDDDALAFAQDAAARAAKAEQPATEARWLEQIESWLPAADAWVRASRRDKALPLLEQAQSWSQAAPMAEALGQLDKAVELFRKAGDEANAARVAALPRPAAAPVQAQTSSVKVEAQA